MLRWTQWNPPTPEPHQVWISLLSHLSSLDFTAYSSTFGSRQQQGGLAASSFFLCLPPLETPSSLLGTLTSISSPKLMPLLPSRCPHLSHEVSQTSSRSARSPVFCPFLLYTNSPPWCCSRVGAGALQGGIFLLQPDLLPWRGSLAQMPLQRGANPVCCKALQKDLLIPSSFLCRRLCGT